MTPQKLKELKKSLLEEKKRIEKELSEIAIKIPRKKDEFEVAFPEYGETKDENAQEVSDFEKLKIIENDLEQRLNQINETLKRIEEGKYGICDKCSSKIEEIRLRVMPTASLCVSCAKLKK